MRCWHQVSAFHWNSVFIQIYLSKSDISLFLIVISQFVVSVCGYCMLLMAAYLFTGISMWLLYVIDGSILVYRRQYVVIVRYWWQYTCLQASVCVNCMLLMAVYLFTGISMWLLYVTDGDILVYGASTHCGHSLYSCVPIPPTWPSTHHSSRTKLYESKFFIANCEILYILYTVNCFVFTAA